jgi:hypothetical protein
VSCNSIEDYPLGCRSCSATAHRLYRYKYIV